MRHSISFITLLFIASCTTIDVGKLYDQSGWPGYIETTVSEFDSKKLVSLEPAYLGDATSLFRLGLRWRNDFPTGRYLLVAEYAEAINFEPEKPIGFNIDGQILEFDAADGSDYGVNRVRTRSGYTYNSTKKSYWVSRSQVEKIISATTVVVRVQFLESYWEEVLEPPAKAIDSYEKSPQLWVKPAFNRFLEMVDDGL
jgi:hypothetical protein